MILFTGFPRLIEIPNIIEKEDYPKNSFKTLSFRDILLFSKFSPKFLYKLNSSSAVILLNELFCDSVS